MPTVNSHNEWDQLEEVIVGTIKNAQRPHRDKGQLMIEFFGKADPSEIPTGPFEKQVMDETEEDLTELANTLQKLDIKVRRPNEVDHSKSFSSPNWQSDGFYNYCPRDIFLVVGDTVIEAPMTLRCRYFETEAYKELMTEYLKSGSKWISAPKPRLLDNTYNETDDEYKVLSNIEPIFDAANIVRAGKDLFFLISSTGNELGYQWLQNYLGSTYRVHPCRNLYSSVHIDSTMCFLRPGLALLNPARVNSTNLPKPLEKWDKIWCPPLVDTGYVGKHAYSSIWVGMNFLMINPNLAIVDKRQEALIKVLEQNKIDIIPLQLRHSRTLGGGFHCVTLDIRRKGKLEDYFG